MPTSRTLSHGLEGQKIVSETSLHSDSYLYHYLCWEYGVGIIENKRLRLSPIQSWTDPYERWWCEKLFNRDGPLFGVNAYGLCWTTSHFDEPAWRMNGFGRPPIVRIRCRVRALLAAARRANPAASLYLGRVKYLREQKLRDLATTISSRKPVSRTATDLLLSKRNAFRFEKEIRLLWIDRNQQAPAQFLPIELSDICQVMATPHAKSLELEAIRKRFGQSGVKVLQSKLLATPEV